jgi:hypothetical protein
MSEAIPRRDGPAGPSAENRIRHLEQEVARLRDALLALIRGIESTPMSEPGDTLAVSAAARQAHELLLAPEAAQDQERGD